ncbi:hypothetical protein BJX63DRAFT_436449 [Aspergillus granulosus]|uniref:NAD-dependent epimerase/dehydratase domain-containing protein n=1 Tax=Aspergillus granulosus TaxID=176169 RepID=A0ABR4GZI8_9EURO
MSQPPLVLITGGTGFLALWVITHLFRAGYRVRTTVRSLSNIPHIKSCLREAGVTAEQITSLEVVQADLLTDTNWAAAVADTTYIQHIASPFPAHAPKDENELIAPAREGTLRVLRAARDVGCVKRVVLTSSFAAVGYGHAYEYAGSGGESGFTEEDWTDLNGERYVAAYQKSKTLAERAAWEFMQNESRERGGDEGGEKGKGLPFNLVTICPVSIYGPALGKEDGTSFRTLVELLTGNAPGIPKLHWPIVDWGAVCVYWEGSLWTEEIAQALRRNLGEKARKVPTRVLPNLAVRITALFWPVVKLVLPELGHEKTISNAKAREVLGWEWEYSSEEAVVAGGESLFKFGIVQV